MFPKWHSCSKTSKASQTSIIENNVEYNPNDPIPIELAITIWVMKKQPCLKNKCNENCIIARHINIYKCLSL